MKIAYGLFPRIVVKNGVDHAQNSLFSISIDPDWYRYGAALAEERVEFLTKWKSIGPLAIVLSAILGYLYLPSILFGVALALVPAHFPAFQRYIETVGHAVYCSAASQIYGVPVETVLKESAESLRTNDDYPYFHNVPVEQIYTKLFNRLPKANEWVFDHLPQLAKDIKIAKEKFNA